MKTILLIALCLASLVTAYGQGYLQEDNTFGSNGSILASTNYNMIIGYDAKIKNLIAIDDQTLAYSHRVATSTSIPFDVIQVAEETGNEYEILTTPTSWDFSTTVGAISSNGSGGFFTAVNYDSVTANSTDYAVLQNYSLTSVSTATLNTNWGVNGELILEEPGTSLKAQKILVDNSGGGYVIGILDDHQTPLDFFIFKFTSNGQADTNYGNNGLAVFTFGDAATEVVCATLAPTGEVFFGGTLYYNGDWESFIAKITSDGQKDASFGSDDVGLSYLYFQSSNNSGTVRDIALDDQGELIVLGSGIIIGAYRTSIARVLVDGSVDTNFGYVTDADMNAGYDEVRYNDLQILSDGNILVSGEATPTGQSTSNHALFLFNADGTINTSELSNGYYLLPTYGDILDATMTPNGKLFWVGSVEPGDNPFSSYSGRIEFSGAAALFESDVQSNLLIYPNPAKDYLKIEVDNQLTEVRILNNLGQEVYTGKETLIDISRLQAGVYTVEVTSLGVHSVEKFIKE
ncbi:MAG: hypothetical protein DCO96_00010 [Fluviicola sp. XM-24bin1]|nr:MAG: hypothetical protein DCO96_00010 [Fluviicola sp. XM-24bin1]